MSISPQQKNNFVIITGGPGSGKTSIINRLREQNYICVNEVGRQIIQEQLAIGGNALHWEDKIQFQKLMLSRSIYDYLRIEEKDSYVFFDRGIPELIGYSYVINEKILPECKKAAQIFRYHPRVFIAPPWQEIYKNDFERRQDFQEAILSFNATKKAYLECHYELIELPKIDIEGRIDFILKNLYLK